MQPFDSLAIPEPLLAEVVEHARSESPNECCGLLGGIISGGVGKAAHRFAIGNDAASPTEYWSNPLDLLRAFRTMRERGLELLAIYHSHPASRPLPSQRDLERNTYGESVVHLIIGLASPLPEVRGWWLTESGSREATLVREGPL